MERGKGRVPGKMWEGSREQAVGEQVTSYEFRVTRLCVLSGQEYDFRMSFTFQIVFRPEPEGGYTVIVPSLPGCVTFGETLEEAKRMAKEAIELYVETLREKDEEVVDDTNTFDTRLQITVA